MVWMPLMNKTNMRRRKSQSPSSSDSSPRAKNGVFFGSKYKRRTFCKRDSGITEASSLSSRWSVQTDGASWRVENFRDSPPKPEEWWEDVGAPDTINVYHEVEHDKNSPTGERKVVINTHVSSCNKKFHNCGYETWVRARQEWKQRTVDVVPERPALSDRSSITRGLRKAMSQRTYQLPRNVALPDLINMYNDIWDAGHK
mmetsp:Transcript_11345/g.28677  ORF Transcript_11345/g.28677 Transcript_11345/m.28677 type:complete len:200 (+) Transcript_11345:137-736(+)|eukprot:CAMPEP_0116094938 /NCGR_PEP_ID=MMETSP0327-20121206/9396_1 /TAXON_ID=44447 /ORGANISM="Pseudo-nitzschia delicatissima, Strain B596" /LENGTH=199 /DNA_ID=CAMNT_0003586571 /DNA_START=30 /DNA_END=629 /DNA_ORIENTATION=+